MSVFKSEKGKQAITMYYENLLNQWPVKHTRYFIDTGFARTHVIDSGAGHKDIILLLHGSSSNSATWMGDVKLWSQSFRVIAVDIPGEPGLSEDRRLSLSGSDTTRWLLKIVKHFNVEQVSLIGMSLGGWYALKFAVVHPDKVNRLTLIAPGGLAPQRFSFIWKAIFWMLSGEKGRAKINKLVYHNTAVPQEVIEFGSLVYKHFNPTMEKLPVLSDEELKRLQFPVQYFGGTKDSLLNSQKSARRLKRLLPRAQVNMLKNTGHAIIDQGKNIMDFFSCNISETK